MCLTLRFARASPSRTRAAQLLTGDTVAVFGAYRDTGQAQLNRTNDLIAIVSISLTFTRPSVGLETVSLRNLCTARMRDATRKCSKSLRSSITLGNKLD